ncbi:holin family protein [Jannaschia sp. LMIT008]|uniref:holin family protein n=1 Tax=Jannaschia maritima TaxID=3032585 RepID=UPI0035AB7506
MDLSAPLTAVARIGDTVRGVSRVFRADASEGQALEFAAQRAALDQLGHEFAHPTRTWFDATIDGLNRLPRPLLAFGTLGLFVFAMVDPASFGHRMEGLALVPEPLWWLLGAIVGFYFGARELHYRRTPGVPTPRPRLSAWHRESDEYGIDTGAALTIETKGGTTDPASDDNPALAEWLRGRSGD